jgi:uncharacterized membrane protein YfcA
MPIEEILVIASVGILIGMAKGGFGPVLGALATPLLSRVMPVSSAAALALPLLMIGDAFALPLYWRHWDVRQIRLVMPAAVIGVFAGAYFLSALPDNILRPTLGIFTLMLVVYKLVGERLTARQYELHNWHGYLAGAASGFGSAVANAGGPPFTAYLLLQKMNPAVFMGTTTLFFITVNLIKLPSFWVAGLMAETSLSVILLTIPLMLLGVWVGRVFVTRVDPKAFDRWMLGLLLIAALLLFI